MRVKEMNESLRPREKMKINGISSMSDEELMQIILKTGIKEEGVEVLSKRVVDYINENDYKDICVEELMKIKGIGMAKATSILAGIEIGRRLALRKAMDSFSLNDPDSVAEIFCNEIGSCDVENFYALLLDTKNRIISKELISKGTINQSIVHPREVFKSAIKKGANSIILVHNHPSGSLIPSHADIEVTKRLDKVGDLVGIQVLDHIIVSANDSLSMRKGMYF